MTSDEILRSMIGDLILQIAMLRGRVGELEAQQPKNPVPADLYKKTAPPPDAMMPNGPHIPDNLT